jgi:hypothetical protein
MALKDTILDVKNMHRSIQLRGMDDPAQVTALLEKILKEAVVAQASGSRTFERKAIAELNQIRQDLVAGQINAGGSKDAMVGIYSHLLDQMNGMQKDNKKSASVSNKAFKQLSNSIPSADTFISALMTANPLVGYGVKIARDIMRSTKVGADDQKAEQAKKLKNLKAQEKYIKDQLKVLAVEESAAKKELDAATIKDKVSKKPAEKRDVYLKILTDIHIEIQKLVNEWMGTSNQTSISPDSLNIDPSNIPIIIGLDQVEEEIAAQSRLEEKLSHEEIKAIEDQDKKDDRDSTLERLKDDSEGSGKLDLSPVNDAMAKEKGGFGKLLEGLIAPIMLVMRTGLMALGGAMLAAFTTVVAIPALIATAVYKLLDGFFNAERIIGKESKDITMFDRLKAGVANIWGTIFKIVDWVTNLFGFDFFDSKDIEKKIYRAFDDLQNYIVKSFEKVTAYGKEKFNSALESATKIYDDIFGMIDNTSKFITGKYDQLKTFFDSLATKGIIETFREMMTTVEDPNQSPHRQQDSEWMGPDGDIPILQTPPQWTGPDGDIPVLPKAAPKKLEKVPTEQTQPPVDGIIPKKSAITTQPPKNPNPEVIRMSNPDNRKKIEGEPSSGKQISGSMRTAEVNANKGTGSSAPVVVAPSTTNNSVNNHQYSGPPTTANLDPDFRSMMKVG